MIPTVIASGDLGDFLEYAAEFRRFLSGVADRAHMWPPYVSREARRVHAEERDARAHRACPSDPQMMERVY